MRNKNTLPVVDKLTPVESKIWELYRQGKNKNEIAEIMGIKVKTVERRLFMAKEKVFLR